MATPKVFISSTCYDLKYIRENLRYFVRTLGYDPILSEDGSIFYNPIQHTHDACLTEIPNTQLFVLIIGGRYGGKFHDSDTSITNAEYREAVRLKIPVFALVESGVYAEHNLYQKNRKNTEIDLEKLDFPSVDSTKIFEFIDEVRGNSINNALVPFRDFGDIEAYLRQQWAAMMFDFLNTRNEERRVSDTLAALGGMNERIEMLSKQILASVGTKEAKIEAELYEEMIGSEAIRDLSYWRLRPTPADVLTNETFKLCADSLGVCFTVNDDDDGYSLSSAPDPTISRPKFDSDSREYLKLRKSLIDVLQAADVNVETYVGSKLDSSGKGKEDVQPRIGLGRKSKLG
ncbi:hypothetical protein CFB52_012145 [Burkholderia sp. AU18528]|uniref:DUF4062 domain-containing protein n=1 Tax=Burkholderia sp. AU18528 TaxID=2015350 RepID=UPI000C07DD8A|nr:DUF4062 domain-containing protein [Burkholderia sp. AU18528]PHP88262.1 hypothetical protein CFB52_012145 [Burkholderia sp. AU18528]